MMNPAAMMKLMMQKINLRQTIRNLQHFLKAVFFKRNRRRNGD